MDISVKIGKITLKQNISVLFCEWLLFYVLIPSRGRFFGIPAMANLILLLCFIGQFLITKKITCNTPKFCAAYIWISIFGILVHFTDRSIIDNAISIVKIIAPFYIILVGITDMDRFMTMLKFIVRVFSVYGVLGIIEAITHFNLFDTLTGTQVVYEHANALRFGLARNRGAADVSINNGMLLCLVLCVAAYVLIYASKKERKWYQLCYLIIFIDAFLTLSRAIWMELVITQILIFIVLTPKSKLKIIRKVLVLCICGGVILLIISPDMLDKIMYIFREMFSSTYDAFSGSDIAESSEMSYGVGHRFLLWKWVWEKTQGYLLFGTGYSIPFVYIASPTYVKKSIEVMWLYMLYHVGFVGLSGYIIFQIGSIVHMIKGHKVEKKVAKDKKITFNYVMLIATVSYFVTQFSCSAFEDLKFYYIMLALVFVYNRICKQRLSEGKI